jgi:hypothetical protein
MITGEYPWSSSPYTHQGLVEKWLTDPNLVWDCIKQNRRIHPDLFELLKDCWATDYTQRPSMEDIRSFYLNLPQAARLVQSV